MSLVATRTALVRPFSPPGSTEFQTSSVEIFSTQLVTPPSWARLASILAIGGGASGESVTPDGQPGPGGPTGEFVHDVVPLFGDPFQVVIGNGGGVISMVPGDYEGDPPREVFTPGDGGATTALGITALGGRSWTVHKGSISIGSWNPVPRVSGTGANPGGLVGAAPGSSQRWLGGRGGAGWRGAFGPASLEAQQQHLPWAGGEALATARFQSGENGPGAIRAATAGGRYLNDAAQIPGGPPGAGPGAGGGGGSPGNFGQTGARGGFGASGAVIIVYLA